MNGKHIRALKAAFLYTIPIFAGVYYEADD